MDNISSLELQTFTDEPVSRFEIKVWKPTWLDRLLRKPTSRQFTIYKTRVCNMGRAASIAHLMPEITGNIATLEDLTGIAMPIIKAHRANILRLIACCIQNNHKEPSQLLIRFLDRNLNAEQMSEILGICLMNSGLQSFLSATMLIKGTIASFASDTDAQAVTTQE